MRFLKSHFQKTLFFILLPVIMVPTILAGVMLYRNATSSLTLQTTDSELNDLSYRITNIDSIMKNAENTCIPIIFDAKIRELCSKTEKMDPYEAYVESQKAITFLRSIAKQNNAIKSIFLYLPQQSIFLTTDGYFFIDIDESDLPMQNASSTQWYLNQLTDSPFLAPYLLANKNTESVLSLHKTLTDGQNRMSGIISINLSHSFITEAFIRENDAFESDALIFAQDKSIICSDLEKSNDSDDAYNDQAAVIDLILKSATPSGATRVGSSLVVYAVSNYTGWYYVRLLPIQSVFGKISSIRNFLICEIFALAAVVLVISYLLARMVSQPLHTLSAAMEKVRDGKLNTQITAKRNDEYGLVYATFNQMTAHIQTLLKELRDARFLKKEAQLKALQAQINPHFLYNTLESVLCLAREGRMQEVSQLIVALSRFFRITLSDGQDMVSLESAANLTRNYLNIQSVRFTQLHFTISLDPQTLAISVPKFLIQPLAENSITHGMKSDLLHLRISSSIEKGFLKVIVEDDGTGITEDKLQEIRASFHSPLADSASETGNNFALCNIYHQLQLTYGTEASLELTSSYRQGTTVTIYIPNPA